MSKSTSPANADLPAPGRLPSSAIRSSPRSQSTKCWLGNIFATFEAARAKAEKKHGKSLNAAAAEDTGPEYDQFCRAGNAERKAAMRMARTEPATIAGAGAMIIHIRREIGARSNREDWEDWIPTRSRRSPARLPE